MKNRNKFLEIMGNSPINRVSDFLIRNMNECYCMVEIERYAKIGYSTLKIVIPILLKNDIIRVRRIIGKSKLYTINRESLIAKRIYELHYTINNPIKKITKFNVTR